MKILEKILYFSGMTMYFGLGTELIIFGLKVIKWCYDEYAKEA